MSEYQFVSFRAVDRPVSEKNLAYMHKQSSRAEITPRSFENEYHYGDFRGDPLEMLRRGYDIHLHYANFGIRRLLIRLPYGLPDAATFKPYKITNSLCFEKDKPGPGGTLLIEPWYEPGDREELFDVDQLIDQLVPIRAEILDGDLRPLYLAHLAVCCDANHDPQEISEAPVPAGLDQLSEAQRALAELFDISDSLIAAAARESPRMTARADFEAEFSKWLAQQSQSAKDAWLTRLGAQADLGIRTEMLAEFRSTRHGSTWPTVPGVRSISQLEEIAADIESEAKRQTAAAAAKKRRKRLSDMAANPTATLRQTEKLAKERNTDAYRQIAQLLADLREVLADSRQSGLADQQAQKLQQAHPKRYTLISALRKQGFLPK